ncbi:MAG: aminoglycoside phosphotransferase family protein [Dehalococcoidia bacterium]|nr:aminoglycoside phosphotransferase family protein [Dehalococcoidia bacterium]
MAEMPDPLPFLAEAGMRALASPVAITGGWDNHIWRFETVRGTHALRVFRVRAGMDGLRVSAIREAICTRAARAGGIPAPEIEHEGTLGGVPFHILSWMPGSTLLDALSAAPWRARALGRSFGAMHARLHVVSVEGLPPLPASRWDALRPRALASVLAAASRADAFCHFDFHPANVLTDGRRITAVLDFTNAGAGDARGDRAMTLALLRLAPVDAGWRAPLIAGIRGVFARAYESGYRAVAGGFDVPPLFRAAAALRVLGDMRAAAAEGRAAVPEKAIRAARRELLRELRAAGLR